MAGTAKKEFTGRNDGFQKYIQQWVGHALLTKEQEYDLIRRAQEEERQRLANKSKLKRLGRKGARPKRKPKKPVAMTALVNANVRLLLSIAQKFNRAGALRGVYLEDLFNVAAIGLNKAVLKFDFTMGCRLNTYATWWIRQELARALNDLGSTIRLPVYVTEDRRKLRRAANLYQAEFGREPDEEALGQMVRLRSGRVQAVLDAPAEPYSLDKPARSHDGSSDMPGTMLDMMADTAHEGESAEDKVLRSEKYAALNAAAERCLDERAREILRCRFRDEMTLDETAAAIAEPGEMPLSRERIRQIETASLERLRKVLR